MAPCLRVVERYGGYAVMNERDVIVAETPIHQVAIVISASWDMLEALENLENDDDKAVPHHAWVLCQYAIGKARGRHA